VALVAKVGTFDCPASTGNSAVAGVGVQPQAVIFFCNTRTSDGSSPNLLTSIGFATDSTHRFAIGAQSDDNVGTSNTRRSVANDKCINLGTNNAGTTGLVADLVSMDSDGFTLNWSVVTSGADIHYLALAGISNATVKTFTLPTSTGSQAVTGVGFQPTSALLLTGSATASGAAAGEARLNVSGSDGTTHFSFAHTADHNSGNAVGRMVFETNEWLKLRTGSATTDGTTDFTSFDSDGFTYNCPDAYVGAYLAAALCLRGLRCKVGTLTVPGGTGAQAVTGVGFKPQAVLFLADGNTVAGTARSEYNVMIGAASGPTARAVIDTDQVQSSDPLVNDHYSDTANVVRSITAGTPTTDYAADLTSFDTDGFTLTWSAVSTSDNVLYVAFGKLASEEIASRSQVVWVG
jgi:hypothetical protein